MEENSQIKKSQGTPVEIKQINPTLNEMEANEKEDINLFFKKTLRNTLSAFFLSMISAVINFFVNIPLLRKVSKESYGIVKVYFELAFTLVNFIPRETIRRASQKFCPDRDPVKEKKKFITVSQMNYLFFCFAIISVFVFFSFMLFTDSDRLHENYIQLLVYILCGLLELAIEPVIMYMNLHMENKFLPITISSISRVVTNSFFVSVFGMDLWGFTLSRIIGSVVYFSYIFCLGAFRYKLNFMDFFPSNIRYLVCGKEIMNETNISYLREILAQFVKLNLLNLILSRCQNVVLSFVVKSTDEEKSDYSFISQNYGLITRFLLEPIIDAFYNLVNKIKHIEPRNDKYGGENDMNGKESPETSMNLNVENNKIQIDDGENKSEKSDSDNNMISLENHLEKKDIKKEKEINYDLTIKLLQLFLKIFTYVGVLMIPYYLLIGTEIMGVIYGKRWENNTIDKIGDCFSYYVVVEAVCNLIKNFGNATNDTHQMNLSYLSLIVNAVILYLLMYLLSKWDICGLIVSNEFSSVFLINFNLYIIFCGKVKNIIVNIVPKSNIFSEINHFIKKCFITKSSIVITTLSLIAGHAAKKVFLVDYTVSIKILSVIVIGAVNVILLYLFERRSFVKDLNIIKSYQL